MLEFLTAQLKAARVCIDLASKPQNSALKPDYVKQAREARDCVLESLGKVELREQEKERIHQELASLASRLKKLGEVGQVYEEAERFLLNCEELRFNAARMVALNRRLMNRSGQTIRHN